VYLLLFDDTISFLLSNMELKKSKDASSHPPFLSFTTSNVLK
jgi:hypothetical protein